MNPTILYILIGVALIVILILGLYFIFSSNEDQSSNQEALRALILTQRANKKDLGSNKAENIKRGEAAILASQGSKIESSTKDLSNASLAQKIVFAHWSITPTQFTIIRYSVMLIVSAGVFVVLEWPLIITFILLTPKLVDYLLNRAIKRRFSNFDRDFPDFLMTIVSRLKSGMNILQAMQASSENMDSSSLLKQEVDLMLKLIQMGYQEEKAIGLFAETVPHPEIELFTQVVILNKRVGGNFASTLERLAKQVRKRQDFRRKAVSAVGEQRGGAVFITAIMMGVLTFVFFSSPAMVEGIFSTHVGRLASQFGVSLVIFGFYLNNVITAIKV